MIAELSMSDADVKRIARAVVELLRPELEKSSRPATTEERGRTLLTKTELAAMLGCTTKTVENKVRSGAILPPTIGEGRFARWDSANIYPRREEPAPVSATDGIGAYTGGRVRESGAKTCRRGHE